MQRTASFELTDCEVVVYTWHKIDLMRVFSAINTVVEESQVEVYEFDNDSKSKQLFYGQLAEWTKQYTHSVCIEVEKTRHLKYHLAGLVKHVKLLHKHILPYDCHKIVRHVTPSQVQLLQAYVIVCLTVQMAVT